MRIAARQRLADDQTPSRAQHPAQLAQRSVLIRDLTKHGDQERGIEALVLIGQDGAIANARSYEIGRASCRERV